MKEIFHWNELADQPHNVASKKERFRAHWKHAGSYFDLLRLNLPLLLPGLRLYQKIKRQLYSQPVILEKATGVAVTPVEDKEKEIQVLLSELGVKNVLVRLPSWEKEKIDSYERFISRLVKSGYGVVVALLQNRYDVLEPQRWRDFLALAFEKLSPWVNHFEVGHAWNRTKWGLWTYREYLDLARPAFELAKKYCFKLIGPAVIDFEFHLYPAVLKELNFDIISSLLYVDRTGAPENAQWGWTFEKKIALLRAIIDLTCRSKPCWITEFNWPLKGMEPYSPAPGEPCVSEEEQANFLVRYFILGLTSGAIERIYWWQLAARGYGLVDPLASPWKKRLSYKAFKTLQTFLEGSTFMRREFHPRAWIFYFVRQKEIFAIVWTKKDSFQYEFSWPIRKIIDRDGQTLPFNSSTIIIEERPKYVIFEIDSF
ncbi:MAG: hypothetical protein N3B16_09440 [Candidatus Aminicenantes bacterium]|nr:hypothetical protein [Candidatus Aminicenantes bacterium]